MEHLFDSNMTVLIPTDFSPVCDNALLYASGLVGIKGGRLCVLHVIDSQVFDEDLLSSAREQVMEQCRQLNLTNIEPLARYGDIYTSINEVAVELNTDLIVMGTHGKKGMQKIMGSYALRVVDSTHTPVLVIQEQASYTGIRNIVFPVSSDEEDRQKAGFTLRLASASGAQLHLFPRFETFLAKMVKMDNVIIQLKQFFRDHGIHVQVAENINDNSNFAKLVIDYSHKISADMVIILSDMKTHHVVLGGKEEDFFFNTYQIPVLCLPARNYKSSKFSVSGA